MGTWYRIALVLVIVGAINWGLIGFFDFNLVSSLFGETGARWIYAIVGLAGLASIPVLMKPMSDNEARHDHDGSVRYGRYSTEASDEFGHYDNIEQPHRRNK